MSNLGCLGGRGQCGRHRAGAQVELDRKGATGMAPRWGFISLELGPYVEWPHNIFRLN